MKKTSIKKTVFTAKQVSIIVFLVVAVIAAFGSYSFKDFITKLLAFGAAAELVVILSAIFLNDETEKTEK